MRIEYTCTLEDYRQANAAHAKITAKSRKQSKLSLSFLPSIILAIFILSRHLPTPDPMNRFSANVDLFLIFLPSLLVPLYSACADAIALRLNRDNRILLSAQQKSIRQYDSPAISPARRNWNRWISNIFLVILIPCFVLMKGIRDRTNNYSTPFWLDPSVLILYQIWLWQCVAVFRQFVAQRKYQMQLAQAWEELPHLRKPQRLTFDDENLIFEGDNQRDCHQWDLPVMFVETNDLILLYDSYRSFQMVPRRAFASEDDVAILLGTLTRKIGNGWVLKKKPVVSPSR